MNVATCNICGGQHVSAGQQCQNCAGCVRLCTRSEYCDFKNISNPIETPVEVRTPINQSGALTIPRIIKIEDTIRSWIVSSLSSIVPTDGVTFTDEIITNLAKEFQEIMDEKLSPVDNQFEYFTVTYEDGKKKVEEIESIYLFQNQNKDYIQIKDHKRINIGKKIAIMEKQND